MTKQNIITTAFVLVLGISLFCGHASAVILPAERQALIDLYNGTDGPNWSDSTNWLDQTGTECTWHGVLCDANNNYVVQLLLGDNRLKGSIPSSLESLSNLQALKMNDNQLTELPAELGNLSNLELLILNNNGLTGIPWELGNLYNLTGLHLNNNNLKEIPGELRKLSSLKYLDLGSNDLTNIPVELGYLFNLTSLNLKKNQLTAIPAEMQNLKKLLILNLDNNQLTGTIPTFIGNLTSLEKLYMGNNQLSGTIPGELENLSNLTVLSLENNLLIGPVPGELANLTNLSDNQSDFRYNALFTPDQILSDFLSKKQIGGDWESSQAGQMDNLYSAILVLRAMAGLNPGRIQFIEDANSDSKIGLEEVIYILQNVSQLRD